MALDFFHLERIHPEDMGAYESWKYEELDPYDRNELAARYGQQLDANTPLERHIEEVRSLTGYEHDFFKEQDLVSPHFAVQFLYKVGGNLSREDFREGIKSLFEFAPELRVNFCPLGVDQHRHKVIFRRIMPPIRYLSLNVLPDNLLDNALQRIMAEDRNRGFDWEVEPLARFTHIAMKGKDVAVLVTISRLLLPAWREKDFFTFALTVPWEDSGQREEFLRGKTAAAVFDYWAPHLEELPPLPQIPGYRSDGPRSLRKVYRSNIDKKLQQVLKLRAHNSRDMLITMLHTAWGLLQRHMSYGRETAYCLIMPNRTMRIGNAVVAAEAIFPVPVRLMCDYDWTMKEIIGRQMRQSLMSQSMSCHRMRELLEDFGQLPEDLPFRIHFHSFFPNLPGYLALDVGRGAKLLTMNSWDEQQMALTLSFIAEAEEIFVEYSYNPYRFEAYGVEILAGAYLRVLRLLMLCWEMKFAEFDARLKTELGAWGNPLSKLGW